jgi:antitoxin component YwqK of YwqJK toxin-antitoxin module
MRLLILSLVFVFLSYDSSAQKDTTYRYFDNIGRYITPDSAILIGKYWFADGLWREAVFIKKTNVLQSTGAYEDKELLKPVGEFIDYREDGTIEGKTFYKNNKKQRYELYYENGKLKAMLDYDAEEK